MQDRVLRLAKARPYNSPIIDEINALVTPEGLAKTEKRMMKTLNVKQTKDQPEYKIQAAYVRTMNTRHPDILVFSDCAAHIKKTKFQQMRANALSSPREKWPDVFVAQPSGDYAGLYLEFKAESPYYKSEPWKLKKDDHNEAQAATMARLTSKGYLCYFVWSVEQAVEITEKYLNQ